MFAGWPIHENLTHIAGAPFMQSRPCKRAIAPKRDPFRPVLAGNLIQTEIAQILNPGAHLRNRLILAKVATFATGSLPIAL